MSADESWVEVVPHDPRWESLFEREAASLRSELLGWAAGVEHFGSTSVPGLDAKPIVDVMIGAPDASEPRPALDSLTRRGYEYLGEDGRRPGRFFWRRRGAEPFNVSVVPYRGAMWESNLAVRDFLRSHREWVDRYADSKRAARASAGESMLAYQDAKRDFVDELRTAAVAWAAAQARVGRVIFMCGPAGSGKSTIARGLERVGMTRLSFDQEAWERGISTMPLSDPVRAEIETSLRSKLLALVAAGNDVVLDFSFWSRASRDDYRELLRPLRVVAEVIYLATSREAVLERMRARAHRDGDDFALTPELARLYYDRFEPPSAEEGPLTVVGSRTTTGVAPGRSQPVDTALESALSEGILDTTAVDAPLMTSARLFSNTPKRR